MINILIVSNEPIPRIALKHLLNSEPGFNVVGEAEDQSAADRAVRLKPDVVIFHAPVLHSSLTDVMRSLQKAAPAVGIVVLGREIQAPYLGPALAAGASGFVLLRASPNYLFNAVRAAARRQRFIDPNLSDELADCLLDKSAMKTEVLSRRERQVLKMFAQGYSVKEIAASLGVGPRSIETYQVRMREKLKLRTRADLVRYALETGILSGARDLQ